MSNYILGYNSFRFEEKPIKIPECNICGRLCSEQQLLAPINFIASLAGKKKIHYHYYCQNSFKEWHNEAYKLVLVINEMPSKSVRELMQKDLEELLNEHK